MLARRVALLPLLLAPFAGAACAPNASPRPTPTPIAPTPPVGAALTGVTFMQGWTDPHALPPPVNTTGWEDSSFISPDGTTLYFGYTRYDYTAVATSGLLLVTGPDRPGQHGDAFDIYEATISGGVWNVVDSTANQTDPNLSEAAIGVDGANTEMVFDRFPEDGGVATQMVLAHRTTTHDPWGDFEMLPAPLNTPCVQDNPTLSADGNTVWWDSTRSDVTGSSCTSAREFWTSHRAGSGWSTPVKLDGGPNQTPFHWQGFADVDGTFYWSGADATQCTRGCLYAAPQTGATTYGVPSVIAQVTANPQPGDVAEIGEMSITADHRFLYFTYGVQNTAGTWDLSIGVAHR